MSYVGADKLGFCWDVDANGTYSVLTNWRRYEVLVDFQTDGATASGAGASQVASSPKQNAGLVRPQDISYLNYAGAGAMVVNNTTVSLDGRKAVTFTTPNAADVYYVPLPRSIDMAVGDVLRVYARVKLASTTGTGLSLGFVGATKSVAYALITTATGPGTTDDLFMTAANRSLGSGGTQVGSAYVLGPSFGTGPRMVMFEITKTATAPDTFTLKMGLNTDTATSNQTGITTLNVEAITGVALRNENTSTFSIDYVKVLYFPATASIQKPYAPNWADVPVAINKGFATTRTITVDAAYTVGSLHMTGPCTLSGAGSLTLQSATNSEVPLEIFCGSGAQFTINVPVIAKKRLAYMANSTSAAGFLSMGAGLTLEAGAVFRSSDTSVGNAGQFITHTSGNSWTGNLDVVSAQLAIRDNACFTNAKTWAIGTLSAMASFGGRLRLGTTPGDTLTVPSNQTFQMNGWGSTSFDVSVGVVATVNAPITVLDCLTANRAVIMGFNSGTEMYPFVFTGAITGPPSASTACRFVLNGNGFGGWNRRYELTGNISNGATGTLMLVVEIGIPNTYVSPSPIVPFARVSGNNTHTGGGALQFGYGTGPTCVTHGCLIAESATALGIGIVQLNRSTGNQAQNVLSSVLTNAAITITNNFGVNVGSSSGYGGAFAEIGGYGAFASAMTGNVLLRGSNTGGVTTLGTTHTGFRIRQNGNIVSDVTMSAVGASYTTPTTTFSAAPAGGRTAIGTAIVRSGGIQCLVLQDSGDYPDGSTPTIAFGSPGSGATTTVTMTGLGGVFTFSGIIDQDTLLGSSNVAMVGTGVKRLTNAGSTFTGRFIAREGTTVIGVTVASSGNSAVGNSAGGDVFVQDVRTALTSVRLVCNQAPGTYNAAGGAGGTGQFTGTGTSYDSLTPATGDRILVWGCSDPRQNGIYVVTATATTWDRASDLDANGELAHGLYVDVTAGTKYAGTRWVLDSYPTTLNSTANGGIGMLVWEQEYAPLSAPRLLLDSGVTFGRGITINGYGGFGGVLGAYDSSNVTYSGAVTLNSSLTLSTPAGGRTTMSGNMTGSQPVTVSGDAAFTATNAIGNLTVSVGTLDVASGTTTVA